jgi:hypothetical protein
MLGVIQFLHIEDGHLQTNIFGYAGFGRFGHRSVFGIGYSAYEPNCPIRRQEGTAIGLCWIVISKKP